MANNINSSSSATQKSNPQGYAKNVQEQLLKKAKAQNQVISAALKNKPSQQRQKQRPSNVIAINAVPNTDKPVSEEAHAFGTFLQARHPYTYPHPSIVFWEGKRYAFTLEIPIQKPSTELTDQEKKDLDNVLAEYKQAFLADLGKNKTNEIKPGADFNILYTDTGYTAFIPNPDCPFNPHEESIQDAIDSKYFKSYQSVATPTAKDLSDIIQLGNAPQMVQRLRGNKDLSAHRPSPEKKPAAPASSRPVGLKNLVNSCYLNAAFQQWATNPVLREELLKDGVIKDIKTKENTTEKNPLYKALKAYEEAQRSGIQEIDLSELKKHLHLNNEQGDAHEAMQALLWQLNDKPDSKLSFLLKTQLSYRENPSSDEIWKDSEAEPIRSMIAQKTIIPEEGQTLETLYERADELDPKNSTKITLTRPDGSSKIVDAIQKRESFINDPEVLCIHFKRTILSLDDKDNPIVGKNKASVVVPLVFKGKELKSFTRHCGEEAGHGHYVTYVKEGENYWWISDTEVKESNRSDFEANAAQASTLYYNKISAATLSDEPLLPSKTRLIVDEGQITKPGADFAIVHPTNDILRVDSEFKAMPLLEKNITDLKTEILKGRWFKWFRSKKVSFSPGEVILTGGNETVKNVLHAVLPKERFLDKSEVQKAVRISLEKAQEEGIKKVALPLISNGYNANVLEIFQWMKEEIRLFAANNRETINPLEAVKIVLTAEQRQTIEQEALQKAQTPAPPPKSEPTPPPPPPPPPPPSPQSTALFEKQIGSASLTVESVPGQNLNSQFLKGSLVSDLTAIVHDATDSLVVDFRPSEPNTPVVNYQTAMDTFRDTVLAPLANRPSKINIKLLIPDELKLKAEELGKWLDCATFEKTYKINLNTSFIVKGIGVVPGSASTQPEAMENSPLQIPGHLQSMMLDRNSFILFNFAGSAAIPQPTNELLYRVDCSGSEQDVFTKFLEQLQTQNIHGKHVRVLVPAHVLVGKENAIEKVVAAVTANSGSPFSLQPIAIPQLEEIKNPSAPPPSILQRLSTWVPSGLKWFW